MSRIDKIYTIHPYYGYRRMYYALLEEGIVVNKKMSIRAAIKTLWRQEKGLIII